MGTRDTSAVKSAVRTLDLLQLLATAEAPMSFRAIGAALGIPASSLSQLLATLEARDFVRHADARGGYAAGPALAALGASASGNGTLVAAAGPVLRGLRDRLGECVSLNLQVADETEVAAVETAEGELTYRVRAGARAPLHLVAAGKALMSLWSDDEVGAYARRADFTPRTGRSIASPERLRAEIAQVRRDGYARGVEEASLGVAGLAATVVRGGERAALAVGLPAARLTPAAERVIAAELRAAAAALCSG